MFVFPNPLLVILRTAIIKDDGTSTSWFPLLGKVAIVLVRSTILRRLHSIAFYNTSVSLLFRRPSFRYVLHHGVLPRIDPSNGFIDNWLTTSCLRSFPPRLRLRSTPPRRTPMRSRRMVLQTLRTASFAESDCSTNTSITLKRVCCSLFVTFAERESVISTGVPLVRVIDSVENKELLQQSTMNTRLSTRSKVLRTRKAAEVSPDHRIERSAESSPSSTEYYSSPTLSQGNSSVHSSVENGMCNTIPHGSLIVIPPHVSAFINENRNNPPVLRSYLGDYYWNALCL